MNQYQFRALRSTVQRERNYNYTELRRFSLPFIRKKISDIKINGKTINFDKSVCHIYRMYKWGHIFDLYSIDYKHISSTLYIITKNELVIYWCYSSIFAPASSAWHLITEVYHGYREKEAIYQWRSVDDFDCSDMMMIDETRKNWNIKPWKSWHSEYQEEMFKKHQLYFIDKKLITHKEANELASRCYYNT